MTTLARDPYAAINKKEMAAFTAPLVASKVFTHRQAMNSYWAWKHFSLTWWERGYQRFSKGVIMFGVELGAILGVKDRQARTYLRGWKLAGVVKRNGLRLLFRMPGAKTIEERLSRKKPPAPQPEPEPSSDQPDPSSSGPDRQLSSAEQALEAIACPLLRRAIKHRMREHEAKTGEKPGGGWVAVLATKIKPPERDEIIRRADETEQTDRIAERRRESMMKEVREANALNESRRVSRVGMLEIFQGLSKELKIECKKAMDLAMPEQFRGYENSIVLERFRGQREYARKAFIRNLAAEGKIPPLD